MKKPVSSPKTSMGNPIALLPISIIIVACLARPVAADRHHITIWNDLATGRNLTIDCRSDTQDVGVHQIPPGQNHRWSFEDPHHTYCYCELISGDFKGQFDVYDRERDMARCEGYCTWYVRPEGLYIHYSDGETTKLIFTQFVNRVQYYEINYID
ncbi:hypothetical protein Cgig2_012227 [Carnegiea gigantea]|uniref:S-protein homolog n=1 Tax=Carnegiea gigantea TaxID=171969 RepID=A0A9Q1KS53_9CARY|nr:hypothetical protein Cgig2_012227 [Carnegiea gigantea]